MTETYSDFSDICAKFYDLIIDPKEVAHFAYSKVKDFKPRKSLFVGSFFLVARELQKLGLDLVVTEYTEEMIQEGRQRLPNTPIECADLRKLPFCEKFDAVFVIGRVFTHMLTPEDSSHALISIHNSLKPGGVTLIDNYEDTKIRLTDYLNGRISVANSSIEIIRDSSTELISTRPLIVNWSAEYKTSSSNETLTFSDQMPHRAFSRSEIKGLLEEHGFEIHSQGDNFDETSFYTVASRKV